MTPLHAAAFYGRPECLEKMLECRGSVPTVVDKVSTRLLTLLHAHEPAASSSRQTPLLLAEALYRRRRPPQAGHSVFFLSVYATFHATRGADCYIRCIQALAARGACLETPNTVRPLGASPPSPVVGGWQLTLVGSRSYALPPRPRFRPHANPGRVPPTQRRDADRPASGCTSGDRRRRRCEPSPRPKRPPTPGAVARHDATAGRNAAWPRR